MMQSVWNKVTQFSLFFALNLILSPHTLAAVSQTPLYLGGGNVPGNLVLTPSVEWPTILSVANLGNYTSNSTYVGYFDSAKCYLYNYNSGTGYFYPSRTTSNRRCGGSQEWSGNFLNWAATPTIDPFRKALTGGYRSVDTTSLTILEKARHTGQNSAGNRMGGTEVPQSELPYAVPVTAGSGNWSSFYIRLDSMGNEMLFSAWKDGIGGSGSTGTKTAEWVYLNQESGQWSGGKIKPSYTSSNQTKSVYRVNVRVKVCDSGVGLESNCVAYGSNYKPEGLLQEYSDTLRYSVFGYLNDSNDSGYRDGAALRANQKFIGPTKRDPMTSSTNLVDNPNKEWSASTGVLVQNPDNITSALGVTISNSGVINYLNKFGQLTTNNHKSYDPVGEMYYAATRLLKNQGNIASYTDTRSANTTTRTKWADGFPVITNWADPIEYSCQKNVILGIGDVNTWQDKNLPGSTVHSAEPTEPSEVTADTTVNVTTATQKVASLESITINTPFTGRDNSAFMAGLAYLANTQDIRSDRSGKQTIATHWVDVRENQSLSGRASNQYWLAAKYGGFTVPKDFGNPYDRTTALPDSWWTEGDTLSTGDKRPRNFYVASDATRMIDSLKEAFTKIVSDVRTTTAALSSNSTSINTDTLVFQSLFDSSAWNGDLLAKSVTSSGVSSSSAVWSAAAKLDALTEGNLANRLILSSQPPTTDSTSGALISTTGINFDWNSLATSQRDQLRATLGSSTLVSASEAQNRLAFLRGSRSLEYTDTTPTNPYRTRASRLGDIVNSDPQYIYQQDFGYSHLPNTENGFSSEAATAYATFRSSTSYKNRTPLVLVGANDGMLHGFDASSGTNGGRELFAYVPNNIIGNLFELTLPAYAHRYYVDGALRVGDAWTGSSWKTLAIGSTGAGGRSYFALDVTDPSSMSTSKVLWEFTHPEMGYTIARPSLVPLANGHFGVIVTSGYERSTSTTTGYVWILDATDGSVIKRFDLPNAGDLGTPLTLDLDKNKIADRIYVADTQGNVWRLDITGSATSGWGIPNNLSSGPLFTARDASNNTQTITAPLDAAAYADGRVIIVFGTGSFYQDTDTDISPNPKTETFYAIIDNNHSIAGRSTLTEQEILTEVSNSLYQARGVSNNLRQSPKDDGWYLDLVWKTTNGGTGPNGERVITKALLGGNRVTFITLIPSDDPCAAGGNSWIMTLDLNSGSRLNYSYFDYNGDGGQNSGDYISLPNSTQVAVSGLSVPDEGAIKGALGLSDHVANKRFLCFASSASSSSTTGAPPGCIGVTGNALLRLSWQQSREKEND